MGNRQTPASIATDWGTTRDNKFIWDPDTRHQTARSQYGSHVPNHYARPGLQLPTDALGSLQFTLPRGSNVLSKTLSAIVPAVPIAPGETFTPNPFENAYSAFYLDKSIPPQYLMHSGEYKPFISGGPFHTTPGLHTETAPPVTLEQTLTYNGVPGENYQGAIQLPQWPGATAVYPDYAESVGPQPPIDNEILLMRYDGEIVNVNGGLVNEGLSYTTTLPFAAFAMEPAETSEPNKDTAVVGDLKLIHEDLEEYDNSVPPPFSANLPFGQAPLGQNRNQHHATEMAHDQQNSTLAEVYTRRIVDDVSYAKEAVESRLDYARDREIIGLAMQAAKDDKLESGAQMEDTLFLLRAPGYNISEAALDKVDYLDDLATQLNVDGTRNPNQLDEFGLFGYVTNNVPYSPFAEQQRQTIDASLRSVEDRWGLAAP